MLPDRLLEVRKRPDLCSVPAWLTSADEVWLRVYCEEMEAFAGRTVEGVRARSRDVAEKLSRRHGISARQAEAVWLIEQRRWKKHVESPVPPRQMRTVVFDLAVERTREDALKAAATLLDVQPLAIERFLFADRCAERVLLAPKQLPTPQQLIAQYNLTLVQSLLMRATRIHATVRTDVRHVLAFAKLLGLMATFSERDDGSIDIELSGPLAIFHDTTKYGHAVARFLPALASTVGWSATADIRMRRQEHELVLTSADPLPRAHALPRGTDSDVEKAVAASIRRIGPERGWELARETTVVRVGPRGLFYPDFTLVSHRGRVLVEIVGFWTPEYLAKKQLALEAIQQPIVICVDERHVTRLRVPRAGHALLVTYRDRIDAAALLDAAERALTRC